MIESGDEHARLVYDAMARSHAKGIADLASVVCGKVDRIVITGGLANSRMLMDMIRPHVEWIAPMEVMAGEFEMEALAAGGLNMVYMGLESGSDAVLSRMNKGATAAEIILAGQRVRAAGLRLSVTAIIGLGGAEGSEEHAKKTGEALSAMQPEYIGLLTLMLEGDEPLYSDYRAGRFAPPDQAGLLRELRTLIAHTDSEGSVLRANHASNYLNLRGTLNADKPRLIAELDTALAGRRALKSEWMRGL